MNILYLHQYFKFPNENGGTRSFDLTTSFAKKGMNVKVVSSTSDKKYKTKKRWTIIQQDGIEVHYAYLPYDNKMSYLKRIIVFIKFLWFACFHCLKIKTDVFLATSTPLTVGIPAIIKKLVHKTPFIFEARDVWPETVIAIGAIKNKILVWLLLKLEKMIYKQASAIVPLSSDMKKSIVSRFPKLKDKVPFVIENIAEINRFQNVNQKIDLKDIIGFTPRFSVLYAGTFGRVNGIDYTIQLAEKTLLIDPKLVYILIGDGSEKEKIIQLAKNKKVLNKNVFILDPIHKEELPKWYNSCSMGSSFVTDIPELWANSANKFFDTLAAKKPVLINHGGWQEEIIKKKNIGFVLPTNLSNQEANFFVEYTKKLDLIKTQGTNALQLAKEKYSLVVAVEKYEKIFKSIGE